MTRIKLGVPDPPNDDVRHTYGDVFEVDEGRLVIAPSGNHTALLFELAGCWELKSFGLLYVLLVSRTGREVGRYQSPDPLTSEELRSFLTEFGSFLEEDGRHAFWIGSVAGEGTLVYDQHNVIIAYGPIRGYRNVLERRGFVEENVSYPSPHVHRYHADLDATEERLLTTFDWLHTPLRDGDDY